MQVAIVGYGKQGRSAYEYWLQKGDAVTICDQNEAIELPNGAQAQLGERYLHGLDGFDLIVRSPVIHPRELAAAGSAGILDKVTTVSSEFLRVCPSRNLIGVTGTKGKGTTSTLITKMLEADGRRVHLGGNIGIAPLDLLKDDIRPDDWVVLELANFQLIDLQSSPHIAVCLMVAPEHLDWHTDLEEYYRAKSQLFSHQSGEDIAIYYAPSDSSKQIAGTGEGRKIPFMAEPGAHISDGHIVIDGQPVCATAELKMLGEHNWQNACAAVTAVWQITQNVAAMQQVLTSFSGLPYRIEFRTEVAGVRYYNDSFASAPPAPLAAMAAITGKKVMIMGGMDRGLDLTDLAEGLKRQADDIRSVIIIGAAGKRLAESLRQHGLTNFTLNQAADMPAIVQAARQAAQAGDAIVLSPGFPSFDMFKNFEDRGLQFNAAVESLRG